MFDFKMNVAENFPLQVKHKVEELVEVRWLAWIHFANYLSIFCNRVCNNTINNTILCEIQKGFQELFVIYLLIYRFERYLNLIII